MTTLPTWLAVLLALASPIVAVVAIGAGELRDRRRLEHEREMQELEEHRMTRLREERLRAYSTFARLTKTVEAENPTPGPALAEAHSEIEMLTDNPELRTAAAVLLQAWGEAWNIARAELERGADNRCAGLHDVQGSAGWSQDHLPPTSQGRVAGEASEPPAVVFTQRPSKGELSEVHIRDPA
jgi:hypothetical protein